MKKHLGKALAMAVMMSVLAGGSAYAAIPEGTTVQTGAVAIGTNSSATYGDSVAIGSYAKANSRWTVAIGTNSSATYGDSVAIGSGAKADGNSSVAIGQEAHAEGYYSYALGVNAHVYEDSRFAYAIGTNTEATESYANAIGFEAKAKGVASVAIGTSANALGNYAYALGDYSSATSENSLVVGYYSIAKANNAIAIGYNVTAKAENAVAIGTGSVADEANTISVGKSGAERKIVNVAKGEKDTDAVNKKQLDDEETARINEDKNLQSQIDAIGGGSSAGMAELNNKISATNARVDRVGATAAALAAINYQPMAKGQSQVAIGMGGYKGKKATAIGIAYQFSDRVSGSVAGSANGSEHMFNVGFNYLFGQHTAKDVAQCAVTPGSMSLKEAELQSEVDSLKAHIAKQDAEMAELKAMVKALAAK